MFNRVMYEKKRAIRDQEAKDLLPTLEKFLELHKKGNPDAVPRLVKI